MERRKVIKGDLITVVSAVRETAMRHGFHTEEIVEDQTTFEKGKEVFWRKSYR